MAKSIYRSAEVCPSAEGSPLVVHCSDPRFQPHFHDFCRKALKLDHYGLIAVPGGPQILKTISFLPKFSWVGWRWAKFMIDLTRTPRLVLILHDDCRWYLQRLFGHDAKHIRERMMDDARSVRAALLDRFGERSIEIYFARLEGNRAVFDKVV